jgi:plastocyanin
MTHRRLAAVILFAVLASGAGAAAEEFKIGMMGSAYTPKLVKAKVGDTLIFNNDDFTNHWVFNPKPGQAFSIGVQKEGETRRLTLLKAGTYEIECVLHPQMNMTVEVTP